MSSIFIVKNIFTNLSATAGYKVGVEKRFLFLILSIRLVLSCVCILFFCVV